ncbi:MAG: ribosome maturation factor RimP [Bacillota bacterium]|nr:ribosome maturation factor RimP [Bacillota bacterium]NLV63340.1 ribosome maturation factor RimP [Clostridiaceae bacterium]
MSNKVTEIVRSIAEPIVNEFGLELVDVEYVKEGSNWYLRVFIDKEGGVTVDDCEAVTLPLSRKLDEIDPISRSYIFEVSSPGIERPFKSPRDFEKAIGKRVCVKFFRAIDGVKTIEGILEQYDGESITISVDNNEQKTYPVDAISKINKVIFI